MEDQAWSVEQLLGDEQFLAWYKAENPAAVSAWELKMQSDASLAQLSLEARSFLQQIIVQEKGLEKSQVQNALNRFKEELQNKFTQSRPAPVRRLFLRWAAAAVLLGVIATTAWWFTRDTEPDQLEYRTAFGKKGQLMLPDSSLLQVNANSSIKYPEKFSSDKREIWIEGEAFLDIQHLKNHTPFIVHTKNYDVEVKGTRFNILARGDRQQIMLKEGSIQLDAIGQKPELLQPGDWFIIHNNEIERKKSDGRDVLAWTEQQLSFEKASLREVAQLIQDHYGVKIEVDKAVEGREVSGIFPNNDLNVLVETLGASQEFRIQLDGDNLRFLANE